MNVTSHPPRAIVNGVGGGLILMAMFTMWWASDTYTGWPPSLATAITVFCGIAALVFVVQAIRLFFASRHLGTVRSASGASRRTNGILFGVVFTAEGILIGVATSALRSNGLDRFVVPAIVVIVGLHFFPMARVFHRSIDLWLATWTTLVGAAGIAAVVLAPTTWHAVWSWVGAGAGVATLSYGCYMTRTAQRFLTTTPPP